MGHEPEAAALPSAVRQSNQPKLQTATGLTSKP